MGTAEILSVISLCCAGVTLVLNGLILLRLKQQKDSTAALDGIRKEIKEELRDSRAQSTSDAQSMAAGISRTLQTGFSREDAILSSLETGIGSRLIFGIFSEPLRFRLFCSFLF